MNRYLCLSATFLDPLFHGQGDGGESEWPPSPMRLFQALLAGTRAGCRDRAWSEAEATAFRWLERRDPPEIIAPEARPSAGYTAFVPNNDADKEPDRQKRLTSKAVRPRWLPEWATLHYLWPIADAEWPGAQPHAETLCRVARHLMALGWGIDQVVGDGRILAESDAAALVQEGRRWRPWTGPRPGQRTWRTPEPSTLEDLGAVHESFLRRIDRKKYDPPRRPRRFRNVAYLGDSPVPPRPYAAFDVLGPPFRQAAANHVAAMLRSLACERARDDSHDFPGSSECYVAGHVRDRSANPPRFSYLPLPTIGHPHADGMIRRVLIAEPFGGDGRHARWADNRLRNQELPDLNPHRRHVLLESRGPKSEAMVRRYVEESQSWATVTPVILPGHDDHDPEKKAPTLLLKALGHAGQPLDAVEDFCLRKAPYWPGSLHPGQFARPDYLKPLSSWHVWIRFREPIHGPLSLGAGRHCGLGLLAATD